MVTLRVGSEQIGHRREWPRQFSLWHQCLNPLSAAEIQTDQGEVLLDTAGIKARRLKLY